MNLLLATFLLAAEINIPYDSIRAVIRAYSKEMNKQGYDLRGHGFHTRGFGKKYTGKIQVIDVGYSLDKRMHYEEARIAFYTLVDGFLAKINNTPSMKDYFEHFPVGYDDLYFNLSFDYEQQGTLKKDDVLMISILDNEITYFILDQDSSKGKPLFNKFDKGISTYHGDGIKTHTIIHKLPECKAALQSD